MARPLSLGLLTMVLGCTEAQPPAERTRVAPSAPSSPSPSMALGPPPPSGPGGVRVRVVNAMKNGPIARRRFLVHSSDARVRVAGETDGGGIALLRALPALEGDDGYVMCLEGVLDTVPIGPESDGTVLSFYADERERSGGCTSCTAAEIEKRWTVLRLRHGSWPTVCFQDPPWSKVPDAGK